MSFIYQLSIYSSLPAATKLGQGNVFTGVCDSVHRGRVSASVHAGMLAPPDQAHHHPPDQAPPPRTRHTTPRDQAPPLPPDLAPPGPGPPPAEKQGSRRQHTVNERPVRILLECILVYQTGCVGSVCTDFRS